MEKILLYIDDGIQFTGSGLNYHFIYNIISSSGEVLLNCTVIQYSNLSPTAEHVSLVSSFRGVMKDN